MKNILLSAILIALPGSSFAMPVMETEIHQKQCNRQGYFYDHDNRECTNYELIPCQQQELKKVLAQTKDGIYRLNQIETDMSKGGFQISQCYSPGKNKLTLGYSKKGLWFYSKTFQIN